MTPSTLDHRGMRGDSCTVDYPPDPMETIDMAKPKGRPRQPGGKGDHARRMKSVRVTLTQELHDAIHEEAERIAPEGEPVNWSAALREILRGWLADRKVGKAKGGKAK